MLDPQSSAKVTDESLRAHERSRTSIKLLDGCRNSTIGYSESGLLVLCMAPGKLSDCKKSVEELEVRKAHKSPRPEAARKQSYKPQSTSKPDPEYPVFGFPHLSSNLIDLDLARFCGRQATRDFCW